MNKLSTTLTMTLLLGCSLQASALQVTDGALTPRSAAYEWIAEHQAKTTHKNSTSRIYDLLKTSAATAERNKDVGRFIALWQTQQEFSKESQSIPDRNQSIVAWTAHNMLKSEADDALKANNAERLLELWKMQQHLSKVNPIVSSPDRGQVISTLTVNITLKSAADDAQRANNAERVLELWKMQKTFTTESKTTSGADEIRSWTVNRTLKSAADDALRANNAERLLELWKMQQAFLNASKIIATDRDELIHVWAVNRTLKSAADDAERANDPKRVLQLFEMQQELCQSKLTSPQLGEHITSFKVHETFNSALKDQKDNQVIVQLYEKWVAFAAKHPPESYLGTKNPNLLRSKYEAAKKEVEKARSLVPADRRLETGAAATNELSVKELVGLYGTMMLDTSSYTRFIESFKRLCKTAVLRLHPDKSEEDKEMFQRLSAHRAWVDNLTEAEFAASPKV